MSPGRFSGPTRSGAVEVTQDICAQYRSYLCILPLEGAICELGGHPNCISDMTRGRYQLEMKVSSSFIETRSVASSFHTGSVSTQSQGQRGVQGDLQAKLDELKEQPHNNPYLKNKTEMPCRRRATHLVPPTILKECSLFAV